MQNEGFIYIIFSEKWNQYYVGSTQNIETRLVQHNSGVNKSTRGGQPWELKYSEHFVLIAEARSREYEIKRKKSRKYLEWLISESE